MSDIKQAFIEGFIERLAARGVYPSDLEKLAAGNPFMSLLGSIGSGIGGVATGVGNAVGPAIGEAVKGFGELGSRVGAGLLLAPPVAAAGLGYLSAGQTLPQEDEVRALQDEQMVESYRKAVEGLKLKAKERKEQYGAGKARQPAV